MMKNLFICIFVSIISLSNAVAQYKKDGTPDMRYKDSKQLYGSSYSASKYNTTNTYDVNGTRYVSGETYKTTGQPKVQRSSSAKQGFLKNKGYTSVPNGYQVDHVIPLSQGGKDIPQNMQLITIEAHKQKTARERSQTSIYKVSSYNNMKSTSTYKIPSYNMKSTSTYKVPSYNNMKSTSTYKAPSYNNMKSANTFKVPSYNSTNSTQKK
jgi:hypothetical protein